MRHIALGMIGFGLLAGLSAPSYAEVETYKLDKPHTQIVFAVEHLGFSKSYGKFLDYDGTILWDKAAPEKSSVAVTIKTASLDMGDKVWNEHMGAVKYFNTAQYPDMTFKSTSIEKTGENTADITGDLTLHGVTKPVTLATKLNKAGKHPFGDREGAGFSATTKIKRSDFGITEGIPMVGDEVDIILEVEAYRENAAKDGTANQ